MLQNWLLGESPQLLILEFFVFLSCLYFGWVASIESNSIYKTIDQRRAIARWTFYLIGLGFCTFLISYWPIVLVCSFYLAKGVVHALVSLWTSAFGADGAIRKHFQFAFERQDSTNKNSSTNSN
jgi:hypothetical protein